MPKASLYREYIRRLDEAHKAGQNLQASWYIYAILEDRLISMLQNSGGVPNDQRGNPIRMLGRKRVELERRALSDKLLNAYFESRPIQAWASKRNALMHRMADGSFSIIQVDTLSQEIADEGVILVRKVCSAALRLKKNREKA